MYLKRIREARGLTQVALAKQVKMPQPYIARLESGAETNPKLDALRRLAKALTVEVSDLFTGGPIMDVMEVKQENRVRKLAKREGYALHKSRSQCSADNLGDFMLVDASRNFVVLGSRFDASLEDIEEYLKRIVADTKDSRAPREHDGEQED